MAWEVGGVLQETSHSLPDQLEHKHVAPFSGWFAQCRREPNSSPEWGLWEHWIMNNQKKNTSDNQSNLRDDDQAKKNRQVESAEAKVVK